MRYAAAPVVRVAFENQALAERPFRHLVGTGSDRVLAEVGAIFFDLFVGHDMREVDRHNVEESGVGTAELDLDRLWIDYCDPLEAVARAGRNGVVALDRSEEAGARTLCLRIGGAVERVFHILGRHRATVVKLHATA